MPPVAACIVPPTRPDPLISGAPVAGVFTIGSAALVRLLGEAPVVGEAHPDPDRLAEILRGHGVGPRHRPGNLRLLHPLDPDPLVGEPGSAQPVGVGDGVGRRLERLAHPGRALDLRRPGGQAPGRAQAQRPARHRRPVETGVLPGVGIGGGVVLGVGEGVGLAAHVQRERRALSRAHRAVEVEHQRPAGARPGAFDRVGGPAERERAAADRACGGEHPVAGVVPVRHRHLEHLYRAHPHADGRERGPPGARKVEDGADRGRRRRADSPPNRSRAAPRRSPARRRRRPPP